MKKSIWILAAMVLAALVMATTAAAQTQPAAADNGSALRVRIHAFLDRTIGWQGLDKMEIESISRPDASGLRTVKVMLAKGEQHQEATYYITADGKEVIEGEKSELNGDPWASNRAKIELRGAPATGAANAPVTIVEYSDLECPFCKQEATGLAELMAQDPGKVRLVFKYFPLTQIHPWSMQAAQAAVCVTEQHPAQFWNFEKAVFDAQDQIDQALQQVESQAAGELAKAGKTSTPAAQDQFLRAGLVVVSSRLRDLALESNANPAAYDACLVRPATRAAVEASIANGKALGVSSTPTLFVNGRSIPGAIQEA
ncbi:MAG: DsbA family protein, partial [Terriglobales bacterium]